MSSGLSGASFAIQVCCLKPQKGASHRFQKVVPVPFLEEKMALVKHLPQSSN